MTHLKTQHAYTERKKMADLKEILRIEKERAVEDSERIYLFKEGSFWRAYEWSAWLFSHFVKDFQITHRRSKNIDQTFAMLGFPETTLTKLADEGLGIEQVSDKLLCIHIAAELVEEQLAGNAIADVLSEWKNEILIKESNVTKKSMKNNNEVRTERNVNSLSDIAKKILSYPLESSSPIDSILDKYIKLDTLKCRLPVGVQHLSERNHLYFLNCPMFLTA